MSWTRSFQSSDRYEPIWPFLWIELIADIGFEITINVRLNGLVWLGIIVFFKNKIFYPLSFHYTILLLSHNIRSFCWNHGFLEKYKYVTIRLRYDPKNPHYQNHSLQKNIQYQYSLLCSLPNFKPASLSALNHKWLP